MNFEILHLVPSVSPWRFSLHKFFFPRNLGSIVKIFLISYSLRALKILRRSLINDFFKLFHKLRIFNSIRTFRIFVMAATISLSQTIVFKLRQTLRTNAWLRKLRRYAVFHWQSEKKKEKHYSPERTDSLQTVYILHV